MREKEILDNIGLVYKAIKNMNFKQKKDDEEWDEVYNSGVIGLIKAVDTYNKNKNIKKSTYYYKCIANEIRNVYISRTAQKRNKIPLSLDAFLIKTDISLEETIPSNQNIEEEYILNEEIETMLFILENYKNKKHREIVKENFGIGYKRKKMAEVAKKYKMSRQYAYETKKRVLQKIKNKMEKEYY